MGDNPCQPHVAAGIVVFGMESEILIGIIFDIIQQCHPAFYEYCTLYSGVRTEYPVDST